MRRIPITPFHPQDRSLVLHKERKNLQHSLLRFLLVQLLTIASLVTLVNGKGGTNFGVVHSSSRGHAGFRAFVSVSFSSEMKQGAMHDFEMLGGPFTGYPW